MTIVYYTFCRQLTPDKYRKAVSSLPDEMQEKIEKFRRWQDAHSFLYGKLLLKEGMLKLGYQDSLAFMKKNEYGKPYFSYDSFSFNISHSEDYVVCVISTDEKEKIGIDIEKIKTINREDYSSVFTPLEKNDITSDQHFYKYWTRKEAVIKADGRGLQIPLHTIDATKTTVEVENEFYFLLKIDIDKEYEMHLASSKKIEDYTLQYNSLDNL
ncbi:hypothetical protein D0817_19925 [Flavobacterium cupreum]|uniref:Uncharacterized protein n=1 Tax=Flavobacterium cupreum TaxID=2133766 RepID=A0A434A2K1_9FLAO|nr:4'-phosphopantetheinyl transferase superfamily protein [Flavobacterium cupreum]RUT68630.1 hypothetical protein D0817_19925 [Flavobacterium cupreum]